MNNKNINMKVLVSGAEFFNDYDAINSYMDDHVPVDVDKAVAEHAQIVEDFRQAGIEVVSVPAPEGCQDGVYTANWALISGKKAIMANLPNKRQPEEPYAEAALRERGHEIVKLPRHVRFSGQGDALPCGRYLFVGSQYRTSREAHPLLARETGLEVIGVQTIPEYDNSGNPVINLVTGWEDSFFYDLDLAIAVIDSSTIAWCPEAFMPESRERIEAITDLHKIAVSLDEAMQASACNLVSTGEYVIMSGDAPGLQQALEERGYKVLPQSATELMKGGGFIRCCSLTLS